jgi:signal transduction histidine kinase/DNA-binding response OmpR family regulator
VHAKTEAPTLDDQFAPTDPLDFIASDTEAGRLIRKVNWAATPLGPPDDWSPGLRMMVPFVLANRFPMLLWWGPEYIQFYNDAYAPILGDKHPRAMGIPTRETWVEIWHVLKPLIDTPFHGGPATWIEDFELPLERHGFTEETHFTVAYSPVPDESEPGGIGGALATVHEISAKVIGERRSAILRELGSGLADAKTDEQVCEAAIRILAKHPRDLPFAIVYLLDAPRATSVTWLRRMSMAGLDAALAGPHHIDIDARESGVHWPLADSLHTEQLQSVSGLRGLPEVAIGAARRSVDTVAVVPIKSNFAHKPAGALAVGLSPYSRLDATYAGFIELVSAQIATALSNARAYEEERRRAAALAEIDRAKTAFFSNVSHEFRTPLTLMLGPLGDALRSSDLPAAVRAQLEVSERNSLRLLKLVNSLLDFARIEAGRVQANYEATDLAALTQDLASNFRSAMERAGLAFTVDCDSLPRDVFVDREMWEKIVLNLLSNAFKYTLTGAVTVRLVAEKHAAVLEVEDTGVGVPEHELPRLFERFHRVEGSAARTHEGSGIGLALVQELVKLHGGELSAESVLAKGSTFRVRIPFGHGHLPAERVGLHSTAASTAIASQAFVQEALRWLPDSEVVQGPLASETTPNADLRFEATRGARIVLADDNADMRAYVRELLGSMYRVDVVTDGLQALDAARREAPDLIITDVMMPRIDGFELLAAVRADARLRDVPVILLSARAGEESRIEGLNAGADDYVVKPFAARELLARVGSLLELRRIRRESDERFRAFVQATSDVIYRMNADWSQMRQLHGREVMPDTHEPDSAWIEKYIPNAARPRVLAAIQDAIREKRPFELEHQVLRADGSIGWTFSRAIPMLGSDGEIIEWFGAASDVSERRATQEALEQQRLALEEGARQKDEFLAMLAHELRNPLAPIRNSGELLSRKLPADAPLRSAVQTIERQVTHLTRLVDDLLDVSRITRGRIELKRKPTAVADLVARALETVDPLIRARRHKVSIEASRWDLYVDVDPERMVQCIANVLTNAAKYTEPGGEIRIATHDVRGFVNVEVQDNGIGIPPDLMPKIFELFVQGARTLDRSQGGLGIGLSIVKRLVEMHQGTVSVTSNDGRRGTTFEIQLPLLKQAVHAPARATAHVARPRRILVVDDNEDSANTLAMILQHEGHTSTPVYSGQDALEGIAGFKPDVVLLDIGLPGLDGYEVAARIRSMGLKPAPHVVAVTGYGQESDRQRVRSAGFSGHLIKPVEFAELGRILESL